jgi:hypothetical protein
MTNGSTSTSKLIFIPSIITLAVTLLRLIGELRQWNEVFFRRSFGGGGAIVGIAWLAIIFPIYFALKLRKAGQGFQGAGKAIGLAVLSLVVFVAGTFLALGGGGAFKLTPKVVAGMLVIVAGVYIMRMAWPAYWNVLLIYALAARIPVIIVYYLTIQGSWNTHYDAAPPNVTFPDLTSKFVSLGLVPQIFFWIPFTIIVCGLIGTIVAAIAKAPEKMDV